MNWKEDYKKKLVSAEEAAKLIKSGNRVFIAFGAGTPLHLCEALIARKDELEDVEICETVSWRRIGWHEKETESAFKLLKSHLIGIDHDAIEDGRRMEFIPWGPMRSPGQMNEEEKVRGFVGLYDSDVFMVRLSPPDKNGFCGFGYALWGSKTVAEHAKTVIAEVTEGVIRTFGDNYIHINDIDYIVESDTPFSADDISAPTTRHSSSQYMRELSDEERVSIEVIGETVALEIIKDGDTLQMGVGMVSSAIPAFLYNKRDLGIHSEGYPGMIADLVRDGIITGKYKTLNPGKVVSTVIFMANPEQLDLINNNPVFELRDVTYVNNLRTIMAHDNLVSINNALSIDVTGQIASESIGPRLVVSAGGQTDFTIGAQQCRGGRAVTVVPSVVKGGKISRIVPGFEPGTVVTIPRYYADHVVTEYGIARLRGKSLKQRVSEMIAIAHPDFRSELKKEAKRLYDIWI